MKIQVLNKDSTVISIQAEWHSENKGMPGSAWTTLGTLERHWREVNKVRSKYGLKPKITYSEDVKKLVDDMCIAEMPLEIYTDTDDGIPWRHCGTLVKCIPYDKGSYELYMK